MRQSVLCKVTFCVPVVVIVVKWCFKVLWFCFVETSQPRPAVHISAGGLTTVTHGLDLNYLTAGRGGGGQASQFAAQMSCTHFISLS